jgi:hypothetical protein
LQLVVVVTGTLSHLFQTSFAVVDPLFFLKEKDNQRNDRTDQQTDENDEIHASPQYLKKTTHGIPTWNPVKA